MNTPQDDRAVGRVLKDGGFGEALSRATELADSANLAKIRKTWPKYWHESGKPLYQVFMEEK